MSRSNYLQIRLSDIEQANYKALADREGVSLAEWARTKLNNLVKETKMTTQTQDVLIRRGGFQFTVEESTASPGMFTVYLDRWAMCQSDAA